MLADVRMRRLRILEQAHTGGGHLAQIVRWHVGRHADGDSGGTVEQHVGQTRRQHGGLIERAVEVRHPVHGAFTELGEQHLREAREPCFGVTHGGEGFRVVCRTPIALPIYQRVAERERLRHQHHGLVAGTLAVGMKLAENVAHGARRLLVLGAGVEAELRHGVDDTPLHRLQTIADVGQCPIENDVHGIVQVRLLRVVLERNAFDFFENLLTHGITLKLRQGRLCSPAKTCDRWRASWRAACP